jgi:hypothetical protein
MPHTWRAFGSNHVARDPKDFLEDACLQGCCDLQSINKLTCASGVFTASISRLAQ